MFVIMHGQVDAPEIVVQIDAEEEFLLHRVMQYSQDAVRGFFIFLFSCIAILVLLCSFLCS